MSHAKLLRYLSSPHCSRNIALPTIIVFTTSENFDSMAAHVPPYALDANCYSATKYAVKILTDGHRVELKHLKSNIRVTVRDAVSVVFPMLIVLSLQSISPGLVETEFATRMRGEEAGQKLYKTMKVSGLKSATKR